MTSRGARYWSSGAIPLIEPERLGQIIAAASDIAIVVTEIGDVLSVMTSPHNEGIDALDHWEGRDIREVLTVESIVKLNARLEALARGEAEARPVELNHLDGAAWEFPVRYTFHGLGHDGVVLMIGRDLRPIAEIQQQLVRAQLALEQDYETERETETRFRVLLDAAREPLLFVAADSGRITDASLQAIELLGGGEVVGMPLSAHLGEADELARRLVAGSAEAAEATAEAVTRQGRRMGLRARSFRAAGTRVLLIRLDAEPATAEDGIGPDLDAFFAAGIDAIVFTDAAGIIRSANDSFLSLVDEASPERVRGLPLADFLVRGGVDLKVLTETVRRLGHMRLFATRLTPAFGGERAVEISATLLDHGAKPAIVFVIRDARRADPVRGAAAGGGDAGMRSVRELVGTTTLRDIVSETTEVIEKMCIETAVALTNNNRVAAADMLGLSRQSLYVKLRKYGLLQRDA